MDAILLDLGRSVLRFGHSADGVQILDQTRISTQSADLIEAIRGYRRSRGLEGRSISLLIAAPGPIEGNKVMPLGMSAAWHFDVDALQREIGAAEILVVHDMLAGAKAVPTLTTDDVTTLTDKSAKPQSPRMLIQTGVGLGVAALLPARDEQWIPLSGEGGNATLAPLAPDEDMVQSALRSGAGGSLKFPSAETLLCGNNLPEIYSALGGKDDLAPTEVSARALNGDEMCERTMRVFAGFLGTFAANAALTYGAQGGVMIAGPIPNSLSSRARRILLARFTANPALHDYLSAVPIHLIHDEFVPLRGLLEMAKEAR